LASKSKFFHLYSKRLGICGKLIEIIRKKKVLRNYINQSDLGGWVVCFFATVTCVGGAAKDVVLILLQGPEDFLDVIYSNTRLFFDFWIFYEFHVYRSVYGNNIISNTSNVLRVETPSEGSPNIFLLSLENSQLRCLFNIPNYVVFGIFYVWVGHCPIETNCVVFVGREFHLFNPLVVVKSDLNEIFASEERKSFRLKLNKISALSRKTQIQ
jgi:hypothetical protein